MNAELFIVDQHVQLGADGKSNNFSVDAGIMINSGLVNETITLVPETSVQASDAGVTPENIQDHLSVFTQQTSKIGLYSKAGELEKNRNDAVRNAKSNTTLTWLTCLVGSMMLTSGVWTSVEFEGKDRASGIVLTAFGVILSGASLKAGRSGAEHIVYNSNNRAETIASARTLFALAAESGSTFKVKTQSVKTQSVNTAKQ